ncbi:MAG TPA: zinc ribbon domain-containing protein [Pyrinomonadaceae bacterium]
MFCPKCATPNADDARFCRSCGIDIGLVPQALSGALAERMAAADAANDETRHGGRRRHKGDRPPSIERALRGIFMGLAFIFIAFAVRAWAPAGNIWWFWMFIPAALNLADGVSTYLRISGEGRRGDSQPYVPPQTAVPPPHHASALPPRDTGEMIPPPSVTEATTRHLGVPAERKRGDG